MRKTLRLFICILALLLAFPLPLAARAAELNVQEKCSLTLHYTKDGTAFPDLEIRIFKVAAYESDGDYNVTQTFGKYPVKIHAIRSQKEWQESAQALTAYIEADNLTPTATGKTDETGTVVFQDLSVGLYLVLDAQTRTEDAILRFQPFFIFLPTPKDNGSYNYHMEANPKPGTVTPITQYKVVKLWKDSANKSNRPTSVSVEILKDGVVQETVELNSANNWSYTWETTDGESQWRVLEKDVPEGYTVSVSSQKGTFTITNQYPPKSEEPPKTGDTSHVQYYIAAMCASGLMLVALGSLGKRRRV